MIKIKTKKQITALKSVVTINTSLKWKLQKKKKLLS